ncbi:hypothetical protein LJC34_08170, partial [Oscillospiraceae bacterium OttesenSCG-928-G22]|nr:hypothetical protein [Oscillospiraceae bacterium OttesenSCG-928-G22]
PRAWWTTILLLGGVFAYTMERGLFNTDFAQINDASALKRRFSWVGCENHEAAIPHEHWVSVFFAVRFLSLR